MTTVTSLRYPCPYPGRSQGTLSVVFVFVYSPDPSSQVSVSLLLSSSVPPSVLSSRHSSDPSSLPLLLGVSSWVFPVLWSLLLSPFFVVGWREGGGGGFGFQFLSVTPLALCLTPVNRFLSFPSPRPLPPFRDVRSRSYFLLSPFRVGERVGLSEGRWVPSRTTRLLVGRRVGPGTPSRRLIIGVGSGVYRPRDVGPRPVRVDRPTPVYSLSPSLSGAVR